MLSSLILTLIGIAPWAGGFLLLYGLGRKVGWSYLIPGTLSSVGILSLLLIGRGKQFPGYCCDNGDGISCARPGLFGYLVENLLGIQAPDYIWWPFGPIIHGFFIFLPVAITLGALILLFRKFLSPIQMIGTIVLVGGALTLYLTINPRFFPYYGYSDCRAWSD